MTWGNPQPSQPTAFDPNSLSAIAERDRLLAEWETAKGVLERAKASEMEARKAAAAFLFPTPKEGTQRIPLNNGFNVKMVHKVNTKISASNDDVDAAEEEAAKIGNEGQFLFERIITWKPEFSKSEFKKLDDGLEVHKKVKALVEKLIVETPGAPTLEIEEPKKKL